MNLQPIDKIIKHGHLFCGIGGGAIGFNRGHARVGNFRAKFKCVGGIDVDPASCKDFDRLVGAKSTCRDLFTVEQYQAFHGSLPPPGWKQAMPIDIRRAFTERPNVVFLSAPCKGFSGLLSEKNSATAKYQALNGLTLRGLWLLLEAYKDDPVELIVFENVPRIATRGRHLLDQILALLRAHGYAANETDHDCGELGNLGQSRKRFLLVARHRDKVPPFLYEPVKHPLRGVGEILDQLPLPLSGLGGSMHRMPALQWKTWVRLAFVIAGKDWRSLNDLVVENGNLRDFGIMPTGNWHRGAYGVNHWGDTLGCVTSRGTPSNGRFAVADPRAGELVSKDRPAYGVGAWDQPAAAVINVKSPGQGRHAIADIRVDGHPKSIQLGVSEWKQPGPVVTSKMYVGGGRHAVADPRMGGKRFNTTFRLVRWDETSPAVAGPGGPAGGLGVADVRTGYGEHGRKNVMRVTPWQGHAGTVTAGHSPSNGAGSVADPRIDGQPRRSTFGVLDWGDTAGVIGGESLPSNGAFAVSDPRPPGEIRGGKYKVSLPAEPAGTVIAESTTGNGAFAVADCRPTHGPNAHASKMFVADWNNPGRTVTGSDRVGSGAACVADPRCSGYSPDAHRNKLKVTEWGKPAGTVTSGKHVQSGGGSVADPRPGFTKDGRQVYITAGHYGVVPYGSPTRAVTGTGQHDNGFNSVADERVSLLDASNEDEKSDMGLPQPNERLVCVILALDQTWHRPFTTLELAALQGLVNPDELFELDGLSDSGWRERIGNCVPPPSAEAIASVMGETLLLAWTGQTFTLSSQPIWVRNVAVALSVKPDEAVYEQ